MTVQVADCETGAVEAVDCSSSPNLPSRLTCLCTTFEAISTIAKTAIFHLAIDVIAAKSVDRVFAVASCDRTLGIEVVDRVG